MQSKRGWVKAAKLQVLSSTGSILWRGVCPTSVFVKGLGAVSAKVSLAVVCSEEPGAYKATWAIGCECPERLTSGFTKDFASSGSCHSCPKALGEPPPEQPSSCDSLKP